MDRKIVRVTVNASILCVCVCPVTLLYKSTPPNIKTTLLFPHLASGKLRDT